MPVIIGVHENEVRLLGARAARARPCRCRPQQHAAVGAPRGMASASARKRPVSSTRRTALHELCSALGNRTARGRRTISPWITRAGAVTTYSRARTASSDVQHPGPLQASGVKRVEERRYPPNRRADRGDADFGGLELLGHGAAVNPTIAVLRRRSRPSPRQKPWRPCNRGDVDDVRRRALEEARQGGLV